MKKNKIKINDSDKKIIIQIQELYLKNFIIYRKSTKKHAKIVIKNCNKISELISKTSLDESSFWSNYIKKHTEKFEDYLYNVNYYDRLFVHYEDIQIQIHIWLKEFNAGYCFDHKINLHYCSKCKIKVGVDEEGDQS